MQEIYVFQEGLSVVLGIALKSNSSTFNVYRANALHHPNEEWTRASVYHFSHEFVPLANDNSQYAELISSTLKINVPGKSHQVLSKCFFHQHGWNTALFAVLFLWVEHHSSSQLFIGFRLVAWEAASFLFSGWLLPSHISYCTVKGQKWQRWLSCIYIHTLVSSVSF